MKVSVGSFIGSPIVGIVRGIYKNPHSNQRQVEDLHSRHCHQQFFGAVQFSCALTESKTSSAKVRKEKVGERDYQGEEDRGGSCARIDARNRAITKRAGVRLFKLAGIVNIQRVAQPPSSCERITRGREGCPRLTRRGTPSSPPFALDQKISGAIYCVDTQRFGRATEYRWEMNNKPT
ncbi:unnamed protein product [Xylocopa violacea]|uniref:Uncharacterized protein n=1 Tax=Xylocopa violacea TaxID=135666 RepID=A0ABP1NNQ2_XYLVO